MSQTKSKRAYQSKRNRKSWARSKLALYIALSGIVLLAAALFTFWKSGVSTASTVPVEVKGQPSLKVDQDKLDFGDVKLGKVVTASFTLSNVGDRPLRITDKPYIQVLEGC